MMASTLCLLNVHDFRRPIEMDQYFGVWHVVFISLAKACYVLFFIHDLKVVAIEA
jgi:hypothetical protein